MTISPGGPSATIRPSRMAIRWVAYRAAWLRSCSTATTVRPLLVQLGAQVQHLDLVRDVQEGGRLVEQQQRRLLGQRHRDPHPLPLPAGELVDESLGKVLDPVAAIDSRTTRSS